MFNFRPEFLVCRWRLCRVAVFLCGIAAAPGLFAASIMVSPATISNDRVGPVSLSISGIAAGQTVVLERIFDENGNGAVDAGEPATLSLRVTDGQLPVIGGVQIQMCRATTMA